MSSIDDFYFYDFIRKEYGMHKKEFHKLTDEQQSSYRNHFDEYFEHLRESIRRDDKTPGQIEAEEKELSLKRTEDHLYILAQNTLEQCRHLASKNSYEYAWVLSQFLQKINELK